MRILILGGSGMLGHRLWIGLQESHDTWVTIRGSENPFPKQDVFPEGKMVFGLWLPSNRM